MKLKFTRFLINFKQNFTNQNLYVLSNVEPDIIECSDKWTCEDEKRIIITLQKPHPLTYPIIKFYDIFFFMAWRGLSSTTTAFCCQFFPRLFTRQPLSSFSTSFLSMSYQTRLKAVNFAQNNNNKSDCNPTVEGKMR